MKQIISRMSRLIFLLWIMYRLRFKINPKRTKLSLASGYYYVTYYCNEFELIHIKDNVYKLIIDNNLYHFHVIKGMSLFVAIKASYRIAKTFLNKKPDIITISGDFGYDDGVNYIFKFFNIENSFAIVNPDPSYICYIPYEKITPGTEDLIFSNHQGNRKLAFQMLKGLKNEK